MDFSNPKKYFCGVMSLPGITPLTAESSVLFARILEQGSNVSSIKMEGMAIF